MNWSGFFIVCEVIMSAVKEVLFVNDEFVSDWIRGC
jgi:hypothetical protein